MAKGQEKRGRGRPRKYFGVLSSTERSRDTRERQRRMQQSTLSVLAKLTRYLAEEAPTLVAGLERELADAVELSGYCGAEQDGQRIQRALDKAIRSDALR